MYAGRELKRLDEVKGLLRQRIARRRIETVAQTVRVTKPLQWIDRAYAYWQKVGPLTKLVAAPAGLWLLRSLFGRRKLAAPLMRWGPTIWNFVKGFNQGPAAV
jgi:hypothetical protein